MSRYLSFLSVVWVLTTAPTLGQSDKRFSLMIEGGAVWQNRNDVRVPNETGTEFSFPDVLGTGPYGVFRAEFDFDVAEKHGFRFVFAPLEITDSGTLVDEVSFAGEVFNSGVPTEANYKFSSYRFTYRYRFYHGPTWTWKIGATAFIRDARVALQQRGLYAEDTDLGLVPLVNLQGIAKLKERWRFILDFDGLAASQGRAFDIAAKLGYSISDRLEVAFGYRVTEGGADVEQVYNFAWFNSVVASLRFNF